MVACVSVLEGWRLYSSGSGSSWTRRPHGPQEWAIETQGCIIEAQCGSLPRCLDIHQWVTDIPMGGLHEKGVLRDNNLYTTTNKCLQCLI